MTKYILYAFLATTLTWLITALGSALVLFFKKVNDNSINKFIALSAGVMLAASYFSLLSPAITTAISLDMNVIMPLLSGFCGGGLILFLLDILYEKIFKSNKYKESTMLFSSITAHNIPEGLIVGIAFGSLMYNIEGANLYAAISLAIGIGIQNFPEGAAISLPLLKDGFSKRKAFFFGQLSAIVEPIFGVIGAILVLKIRILLPFMLSFAAGAMIYVACCDLLPGCFNSKKNSHNGLYLIIGFSIMMLLDVILS